MVPYLPGFDLCVIEAWEGDYRQATVRLLKVTSGTDVPQVLLLLLPCA